MKKGMKVAAKCAGVFAAVLAILYLLLVLSACIPNEALKKNYERSAMYYSQQDAFGGAGEHAVCSITDHYADAILTGVSWHLGDGNAFASAINTRFNDGGEQGENVGLIRSVTEDAPSNADYTRYWHGSAMLVRVGHLVTDVNGVKWIGFAAMLVGAAATLLMLVKKRHKDLALLLALSLCAVNIWNIRLSMEYQPAFVLAFALCPLYLAMEKHGQERLCLLSTASGAAVAFFDFLTTETVTLLLPVMLVIAVRAKEGRLQGLKQELLNLAALCLCWGAAYAGAFLVKWSAASLVTGENSFALAMHSVAERAGNELSEGSRIGFMQGITANLTTLFYGRERIEAARVLVGSFGVLAALGSVWYVAQNPKLSSSAKTGSVLMLLLGALVPVRFAALGNHSYLHAFFTHRALCSTVFALLAALRLTTLKNRKKGTAR